MITLDKAAKFVLSCFSVMRGGEVYIPKLPSVKIIDIAKCFDKPIKITGIRPGEKLHECMISVDETTPVYDMIDRYIISDKLKNNYIDFKGSYASNTNNLWLDKKQIKEIIDGTYRD